MCILMDVMSDQFTWQYNSPISRVLPGKKMAGQLGNKMTTIKKLKVIQINPQENILVIKGSVPGKPGNLLSIVPSD